MTRTIRRAARLTALHALVLASGCVINPVTGDRELALVSADQEVAIGEQQYLPSRQMQGGEYTVDPQLTSYVSQVGQRLAAVSGRNLPYEFVVLNNSVPNAWALPGGKIAVNRGLLMELESEAELAAVLGHEIVHAAARHGALAMQRGLLLQGVLLATAVATSDDNHSNLAVGAASLGAQLINQRHGRDAELESDTYGMQYMAKAGYDPRAAVSLQETFVRLSGGGGNGEGWLSGLFASHPPSQERVDRNRQTAAQLPMGGDLGRERYQAATATLRSRQPAYEAYDEAQKALAEDRIDEARRLAEQAARQVPQEAHFHSLLGDIDLSQQRWTQAAEHYGAAIARNDNFFYYHLQRGQAQRQLRRYDEAQRELEASIRLLPTADAFYGLGAIAEQRGDRATALEFYAQAAESEGPAGVAAREAAVRLDLPANPGKYLQVRTGTDNAGRLVIEIGNPTNVVVSDVLVNVRYAEGGAVREVNREISGRLEPGTVQRWATGLGPFTRPDAFQVALSGARIVGN
jgi:predicted Zn-dependent protease